MNSASPNVSQKLIGNNFDWIIDTITFDLKANDTIWVRYESAGTGADSTLWTAGHKWEEGSIATLYMQSASEVTPEEYPPRYIGKYIGEKGSVQSTNPLDYDWFKL